MNEEVSVSTKRVGRRQDPVSTFVFSDSNHMKPTTKNVKTVYCLRSRGVVEKHTKPRRCPYPLQSENYHFNDVVKNPGD